MITLFATRDATLINGFINDPAVLPLCGFPAGTTWADCSDRVADDDIVFVTDGADAMMGFHRQRNGWEKHNIFRPRCRGRAAIETGAAMLVWAFSILDAAVIVANTPIGNRPARWFNRQIGMRSQGLRTSELFEQVEHFRKDMVCP